MSINLEQFHQTFFEESFEGLDSMESGLLNLQGGARTGLCKCRARRGRRSGRHGRRHH
ncbi:MAG TPA: hypothetical protein VN277_05560 [Acidiferrobacterales bacterium]|nr:hypothetical protein [Acidiferrobacterales bacterium]